MSDTVSTTQHPIAQNGKPRPVSADDRLLAEAVRWQQEGTTEWPPTDPAAFQGLPTAEHKIVAWSQTHPQAASLRHKLRRSKRHLAFGISCILVLAFLAGLFTSHSHLRNVESRTHANISDFLLFFLGIPTLAYLLWLAVFTVTGCHHQWTNRKRKRTGRDPGRSIPTHDTESVRVSLRGGWIGGWMLALIDRISRRFTAVRQQRIAWRTLVLSLATGVRARWTLSCLTHAFWLAFHIGCLLSLLLLLASRHYTWVWETTILNESTFQSGIRAAGWLPSQLGFATPTSDQIERTQSLPSQPAMRGFVSAHGNEAFIQETTKIWSSFLIGCLVIHGVALRGVTLLACFCLLKRHRRKTPLDLSHAFYQRLQMRLTPVTRPFESTPPRPVQKPRLAPRSERPIEVPLSPINHPEHSFVETPPPESGRSGETVTSPIAQRTASQEPQTQSQLKSQAEFESIPIPETRDTQQVPTRLAHSIHAACVGVELDPSIPWPPQCAGADPLPWIDLGNVDSGAEQRRVIQILPLLEPKPTDLVIFVEATHTPDRGTERLLKKLSNATPAQCWLVLSRDSHPQNPGEPSDPRTSRRALWREQAVTAGLSLERVLEVPLPEPDAGLWAQFVSNLGFPSPFPPTR